MSESVLIFIILFLCAILILLIMYVAHLRRNIQLKQFKLQSANVRHGKSWEQFVPFMPEFEKIASKDNFMFLGNPIDGIAFDEDAIKFIEFKTGTSRLSPKQQRIKKQIEEKNVEWHELRY
ncbi:endonuclease [Candidatus Woesearchaeota archaeon]|nr:endonuclease [Candidatus Woesearchaeota archaeon]